MKIRVTQKHIDTAKNNPQTDDWMISETCPIALAIRERIHRWVCVDNKEVTYQTSSGYAKIQALPQKARKFVKTFDNWMADDKVNPKPKPITFELK